MITLRKQEDSRRFRSSGNIVLLIFHAVNALKWLKESILGHKNKSKTLGWKFEILRVLWHLHPISGVFYHGLKLAKILSPKHYRSWDLRGEGRGRLGTGEISFFSSWVSLNLVLFSHRLYLKVWEQSLL